MTKEYGVACLLDENSVKSLIEQIPFLEKDNYPHISLFQFRCYDENCISLMKEQVKNLSVSKQFVTKNVTRAGNNIFLNIHDDSTLQKSSDKIAEIYAKNSSSKEHLSQINISELTPEQADFVDKYGIYWIKQFYHPHITLLYEKKFETNYNVQIPKLVTVSSPDIYPIDSAGRIKSNNANSG